MATPNNLIAARLRDYAAKLASEKAAAGEGAPDRLNVGDGDGGVTVSKGTIPNDVGEGEVKRDQPADGKTRKVTSVPAGGPDRLKTGDGDGGVTVSKGTVPTDPGEAELTTDLPADGETRKAATLSSRAAGIRAALIKASPQMAAKLQESEKAAAKTTPAVAAAAPQLDLSVDTLAKIASAVLSTDEGVQFTHNILEKQAGEQAALAQIQEAIQAAQSYDRSEVVKQAAFDDLANKSQTIHDNLVQHGITESDAESIMKQAALHQDRINSYDHPLLKAAYAQGMDDAALMTAADDAQGEEGAPPVDEALPMGGEDLSEEDILALLQEMVASGEISEDEIIAALSATEGGGGALPPEGAEGAPAEEAVPEDVLAAAGA